MNVTNLLRRTIASCLIVSFVTVTSACYGPFNLTRNVYHWNSNIKGSGEVNDKWMKEFVFFGMIVVPVYMFSALLDAFVFNSIQFWSGDNPIKVTQNGEGHVREAKVGDVTVRWTVTAQGADVLYERDGIAVRRASIIGGESGYRLLDDSGRILAEASRRPDGTVTLVDGDCRLVGIWEGEQWRSGAVDRGAAEAKEWG